MDFFSHLLINNMYLNGLLAMDETLIPLKSQLSFLIILVSNLNTGKCLLVNYFGFLFALIKACGLLNRSQSLNIKLAVRLLAVGKFSGLPMSLKLVLIQNIQNNVQA